MRPFDALNRSLVGSSLTNLAAAAVHSVSGAATVSGGGSDDDDDDDTAAIAAYLSSSFSRLAAVWLSKVWRQLLTRRTATGGHSGSGNTRR